MPTRSNASNSAGFTLVEMTVTIAVFGIVALSLLTLFTSLVRSTILAKREAVASALATNQMEYLKSLSYANLAVAGGSIYTTNPIPATTNKTVNGVKYTVTTSINYIDDAYDGCGSYPNATLLQQYCRNYPPPSSAPATDTNPQDYKVAHVSVTDPSNDNLAQVDTQIAARVSETASTTGALFVSVLDDAGNPVSGANVTATNSTVSPAVNVSDATDANGTAIFYGLPPDNGLDYVLSASKSGYSSLSTINVNGSLQPTYSNQKILTQQSSYATLTIKPQGSDSLLLEATNTSGSPLAGVKLYVKGGYKKYTSSSDTSYYYDNLSPSDVRPTSDGSGLASISNLVPGTYIACGDDAATSCKAGTTTYYVAAAVPYAGNNPFSPMTVPTYTAGSTPTTFAYGSGNFLQKVRLMLTTSSSFPRISSINPASVSKASASINAVAVTINGTNLPCSSTASSCNTTVKFLQGAASYAASCTGDASGIQLSCTVDLSAASLGMTQLSVTANGQTLTTPAGAGMLGGINVQP